ncbi:MAG: hypothetical protein R3F13_02895 [Prosthecobacter sp.]
MKKSAFDAVAASREWKQSVSETTTGMTIAERIVWFRSQSSIPAIRPQQGKGAPSCQNPRLNPRDSRSYENVRRRHRDLLQD